jgi:hypothetical protein
MPAKHVFSSESLQPLSGVALAEMTVFDIP